MTFRPELIDELLKDYRNPEDLMGENGIFKQLSKAPIERCLSAELDTHLEEEHSNPEPEIPRNRRNGHSKKTIKGEFGTSEAAIPRDRNGANLSLSPKVRLDLTGLTIKSCRCMPVA